MIVNRRIFSGACAILFAATLTCQAKWWKPWSWKWLPWKKAKKVETLIITGNFVKSRLLAELLQAELKQPVLLLPGDTKDSLYALGPDGSAIKVARQHFKAFVKYIHPHQILILGDNNYVPTSYSDSLKGIVPVWRLSGTDWEKLAVSSGEVFHLKELGFNYLLLLGEFSASIKGKQTEVTPEFDNFMNLQEKKSLQTWVPVD